MRLSRRGKIAGLFLLSLLLASLFFVVWNSRQEPLVRRLTWLSRPGACAIYISKEFDGSITPLEGAIRMMVLGGDLIHTTIQIAKLEGSTWVEWLLLSNLAIGSSTSFWVANDVRISGSLALLQSSTQSTIDRIWYDYDEGDEGNSGQRVVCLRSNTLTNESFVARFAVGCGLVTRWWSSTGCYYLYQTNIFLGLYVMFSDVLWIVLVVSLAIAIELTLVSATRRGIGVIGHRKMNRFGVR